MALGGSGPTGGQKESQKNRFGAAEVGPTATSTRPAKTHNRITTTPYVAPSSALIVPWSCVRITPGLGPVEFDRACHDKALGCASSRVWRAYQEVIRQAA